MKVIIELRFSFKDYIDKLCQETMGVPLKGFGVKDKGWVWLDESHIRDPEEEEIGSDWLRMMYVYSKYQENDVYSLVPLLDEQGQNGSDRSLYTVKVIRRRHYRDTFVLNVQPTKPKLTVLAAYLWIKYYGATLHSDDPEEHQGRPNNEVEPILPGNS